MLPALILIAGRTCGFAATFAIPLVLARCFSQADFGTYRELFLWYSTLFGVAQVGMAESLYYFVPRDPSRSGASVINALAALTVLGLIVAVGLQLAAPAIGHWFNNASLRQDVPLLAWFLALMVVTSSFEIILISRKRHGEAAFVYAGSDALKSVLFIVPALMFRSLPALLIGAVAFAGTRALALLGYSWREFGRTLRLDGGLFREQLKYALPFAAAVTVDVIQQNYHQYAVASWVNGATFAIYSVGCLQIPLVDLLYTSTANVMMVRMTEERDRAGRAAALWRHTVDRLALVFFPLCTLVILTAKPLIVTLFTAKYAASVPVFVVSSGAIALAAFPVDAVLRVFADTRWLLWLNLTRFGVTVCTIAWFVRIASLPGAALVTVLAVAFAKCLGIRRIATLMALPLAELLPWRGLALAGLASAIAAGPAIVARAHVIRSPILVGLATGTVFVLTYGAIIAVARLPSTTRAWLGVELESGIEG